MSVGIYKLTNKINGKVYVGQSTKIEKRFKEHIHYRRSLIGRAMDKYGVDNFDFAIVELCTQKDLNSKEQYYISLYNSILPNGYNLQTGGNAGSTSFLIYDKVQFDEIIKDLEDTELTIMDIAIKNNVSTRTIYRINSGSTHMSEDREYPIRKKRKRTLAICINCGNVTSTKRAVRCISCQEVYQKRADRPSDIELAREILCTNFRKVGLKYGVSDNAIRNWCIMYNIPYKKKPLQEWYEKNKKV